jgi:hypothetical protein
MEIFLLSLENTLIASKPFALWLTSELEFEIRIRLSHTPQQTSELSVTGEPY